MIKLRSLVQSLLTAPPLINLATDILPPWVTVFMLHRLEVAELGINGLNQNYLRQCLRYLQENNYAFIALDDAVALALEGRLEKKKWVVFTLDDGNIEQATVAAHIFHEFNCPATCFLISDYIDQKSWPWDYKIKFIVAESKNVEINITIADSIYTVALNESNASRTLITLIRKLAPDAADDIVRQLAEHANVMLPTTPPRHFASTNWDDIRAAEGLGMRFGAHSATHRNLSGLTDTELTREIQTSIDRVFAECQNPSRMFCYPSGKATEFDDRAFAILQRKNIIGAVSAESGYLDAGSMQQHANYRYIIPRLPLSTDFTNFKLYVSWAQYIRERFATSPLQKFL